MDDYFPIGHRALSKVSVAVLLLDDLTGRQITGSNARAWIENEKPPIKKNDGWFVFTNLRPGTYMINAEGGSFILCSETVEITDGTMKMLTLRLRPGRVYPVPSDCLRVEGRAEPGAAVTIVNCNKSSGFKLLSDCKAGDGVISVFHPEGVRLDGRAFRLTGSEGVVEDVFLTASDDPDCRDGRYRLSETLKSDHSRVGSVLMPLYFATADEDGRFFMILGAGAASSKLICECSGTVTIRKEYDNIDPECFRPDLTDK